jgi:hypothetical protein
MRLKQDWLVFAFVVLFLTIPLSTLPGLFNIIGVLIGVIALAIVVLIVLSILSGRGAAERE